MEMTKMMGKCGAGMASVWNGMKRTTKNTRQEVRIADEESRIARLTAEIGTLTLIRLDAGMEAGEEIMERYQAIVEARREIELAQAGKEILYVTCPHCGGRTTAGMRFCGHCRKEL